MLLLLSLSKNLSDDAQGQGPRTQRKSSIATPRRTGSYSHWQNPRSASKNSFLLACPGRWAGTSQLTQDEGLLLH